MLAETQRGPDGASALLDAGTLEGVAAMGDGAFPARVLQLYARQLPVALKTLAETVPGADSGLVASTAHSQTCMSAKIGATHIAEHAARPELVA